MQNQNFQKNSIFTTSQTDNKVALPKNGKYSMDKLLDKYVDGFVKPKKVLILAETDLLGKILYSGLKTDPNKKNSLFLGHVDSLSLAESDFVPDQNGNFSNVLKKTERLFKKHSFEDYFRILIVTTAHQKHRAVLTGIALGLASKNIPVNIFSSKNRTPEDLLKKIKFTLSLDPMPKNGVGDGVKVLPSSFLPTESTREVKRFPLSEAERMLKKTFENYKKGEKLLIAIDPGAGKTTTLSKIHEILGPMLFLSPTIKLAQEFVNAVGPGATLFRGRSETLCHKTGEVDLLGNSRRSIAANLCQKCEHGIVTQIGLGSEKAELTKEVLEHEGVDFSEAKPCGYILQMHNLKNAQVLAAAEASLAGNPKHLTHYGMDTMDEESSGRLVVWDDCFTPYTEVLVKESDLLLWLDLAKKELEFSDIPENQDWLKKACVVLERILELYSEKREEEDSPLSVTSSEPPEGFVTWKSVGAFFSNYPIKLKHMDGTVLEAIRGKDSEKIIPLRGILDLATALELGTVWITNKTIVFTIPTLSLDTYLKSGGIVLDATPHPFVREIADRTVEIRIEQPDLHVSLDASSWRGRTGLSTKEGSLGAAKNLLDYIPQKNGENPVSVITHKPIASAMKEILQTMPFKGGLLFGHWGAHNRGHNDYMKTSILILDGVPVPPPDAFFIAYESCRNLLSYCAVSKKWKSLEKINAEKGLNDQFLKSNSRIRKAIQLPLISGLAGIKAFVPDNLDAEKFLRDVVTAEVVQAVGRLRAVRRPGEQLEVLIRTAFPLSSAYGLELHKVWGDKDSYEIVEKCKRGIVEILPG